jgi:hypothetical protein
MEKKIIVWAVSILAFTGSFSAYAQDYKYHSVFIYNFTKYIQWPSGAQNGTFVIGVLGNSSMLGELEKLMTNKTVGTQTIVIKKITNISESSSCHAVFIPSHKSGQFDADPVLRAKPVLFITEMEGLGKKGSHINFIIQDGKLRFELNQTTILESGLKVSSQLNSLALTVYNDGVASR